MHIVKQDIVTSIISFFPRFLVNITNTFQTCTFTYIGIPDSIFFNLQNFIYMYEGIYDDNE